MALPSTLFLESARMDMQHDHDAAEIELSDRITVADATPYAAADTHGITYDMLMHHAVAEWEAAGRGTKNHCSHLRRWVEDLGLAMQHPIGVEFDDDASYRDALKRHLKRAQLKNDKDRRSSISSWRDAYLALRRTTQVPETLGFAECLQAARAAMGYGPAELAKEAGVSAAKIRSWESEKKHPNTRSRNDLERLENALKLPAGRLTSYTINNVHIVPFPQREATAFVKNQREYRWLYGLQYRHWPESARREWQELLKFYTCMILPSGIFRNATWRTRNEDDCHAPSDERNRIEGKICPTAHKYAAYMTSYYGWLVNVAKYSGGLSLVLLSDVKLIEDYIEWQRQRRKAYTASTLVFLQFVSSFLRRETGFLRQYSEYGEKLAEPVLPDAWDDWCERAKARVNAIAKELKKAGVGKKHKSRDPLEPIARILMLDNPLDAIVALLDSMEALLATRRPGSAEYHTLCRDKCLISLLSAIPLRADQFATMRWHANNTGNLYKNNGVWKIRFVAARFKNAKSYACKDLDQRLPERVYRDLERYLEVSRPTFLKGKETDKLFLTRGGKRIDGGYIYHRVQFHTAQHISSYTPSGFGTHAMRHIVATAFLKKNPGAFPLVAELLNDTLDTVMREYGHLAHNDGFRAYEEAWQPKKGLNAAHTRRDDSEDGSA